MSVEDSWCRSRFVNNPATKRYLADGPIALGRGGVLAGRPLTGTMCVQSAVEPVPAPHSGGNEHLSWIALPTTPAFGAMFASAQPPRTSALRRDRMRTSGDGCDGRSRSSPPVPRESRVRSRCLRHPHLTSDFDVPVHTLHLFDEDQHVHCRTWGNEIPRIIPDVPVLALRRPPTPPRKRSPHDRH